MAVGAFSTTEHTTAAAPPHTLPVLPDAIPDDLATRRQWVGWRWEYRPGHAKPWTKIPTNPHTGRNAAVDDSATWGGLADALVAAERFALAGVGFVFTDGDPFAGVDLDGCADPASGDLASWAAEIVADLASYTECSPSGTGVHVIVRGALPANRRRGAVELYDRGRFFCVTGHRLPWTPATVEDRAAELAALNGRVATDRERPGGARSTGTEPGAAPPLTDAAILDRAFAARNGAKVRRLYGGDAAGYPSRSEADLALCLSLAFWTRDRGQLDRLVRGSGLMRPKWDERHAGDGRTYGELTLGRALDLCREQWAGTDPETGTQNAHNPQNGRATDPDPAPWEPPAPLGEFPRPAFPTDRFPATVRAFVVALARATQTPPALAALLCLAVLAAAGAKRFAVRVRAGCTEPLCLFVAVALPPANRKTAVFGEVVAPLLAWERDEAERLRPEIARAASERRIKEAALKHAERLAAQAAEAAERAEHAATARRLAEDLDALAVSVAPRLIAEDCTPEAVASLLAKHGGRLAVLSDEGGIFDLMAGRYAKGGAPNLDVFLKGHAGSDLRVDRTGRAPEHVESPALTLGLAVQPAKIRGLAARPEFRGLGLLARFLYGVPESTVGRRLIEPPPVPEPVRAGYAALIAAILALSPGGAGGGVLAFSPGADAALKRFEQAIEPRLAGLGDLAHVADWAGKLAGAVVRVAGCLHLAEHAGRGKPWSATIGAATVESAVGIAEDFLIPHALAAFAELGADPTVEDARRVLLWIERHGGESFSRRDAHQALRATFRRPAELDPALRLLEEHGYVRAIPEPGGAGPGRPPSPRFAVNPHARGTRPDRGSEDSEDCVRSVYRDGACTDAAADGSPFLPNGSGNDGDHADLAEPVAVSAGDWMEF